MSIHDQMTFDFTQLKRIALLAGLQHQELAALLKITRPTFYLWCRGGKPQTLAAYEHACKVLKAINRGLKTRDFPIPEGLEHEERAKLIAERYARNYVAE